MDSFYGDPTNNTSGQGEQSVVPPEIQKWNWGAFFLSWIWGIGNQVWIALLSLIPFVNIIMIFVLGAKGNEWAWRAKRWESVEHFLEVQRKWSKWGFIVFIVIASLILLSFIATVVVIPLLFSSLLENSGVDPSQLNTPTVDPNFQSY